MEDSVVIVGGSLSGLTLALACATRGVRTQVLEQFDESRRSGAALGINRSALLRAIGLGAHDNGRSASFPVITGYRHALAWQDLYDWLQNRAKQRDEIRLTNGITISNVVQSDECATAITSQGRRIDASVIVGADGYRSVVRRAINPKQPAPLYAGYLLWRGMVDEAELQMHAWPDNNDGIALVARGGDRLVAYPVAGRQGSLQPGDRMISFSWYDASRNELLRKLGCLSQTAHVLTSLAAQNVTEEIVAELCGVALKIWPDPWRTIIVHTLKQRSIFATPVAEHFPERLFCGRLVMIGDAAHVISPATGGGFTAGILDAEVLANSLAVEGSKSPDSLPRALEAYARIRLAPAQQLVESSKEWSKAFLRGCKK